MKLKKNKHFSADSVNGEMFLVALSTAILAAMTMRNLISIRYYYPDVLNQEDYEKMRKEIISHLESAMSTSGFDKMEGCFDEMEAINLNDYNKYELLFSELLLNHPDLKFGGDSPNILKESMEKALDKCKEAALTPVCQIASRLSEMAIFDCRIPSPLNDPSFKDIRRFAQMLRIYWEICRPIFLIQINAGIYFTPHPLLKMIVNMRERLDVCFEQLNTFNDSNDVKDIIDSLFDELLSGEPDGFSAVPEWANELIQKVDVFAERTRLDLGSNKYPLTGEEESFIELAKEAVAEYDKKVKKTEAHLWKNANLSGLRNENDTKKADQNNFFPTPKGTTWKDVTIRFVDGHTVAISVGDGWIHYNYAQMGMLNKKNGNFTEQWKLLQGFADSKGEIDWNTPYANVRVKKQKQELSKRLRFFFRMDDDPIEYVKKKKAYRCRFWIFPDNVDERSLMKRNSPENFKP